MGDAAGELPHRLHFLGLEQGLLGGLQPFGRGLLRGHVAGDRINVLSVCNAGPGQPAVGSVLVPEAAFESDGGVGFAELPDLAPRQSAVVGMFQPLRGATEQFRFAPAESAGPCRIDGAPDAGAIRHQQQILRYVPDPVALAGLFLDALRQRRVQVGELVRELAEALLILP